MIRRDSDSEKLTVYFQAEWTSVITLATVCSQLLHYWICCTAYFAETEYYTNFSLSVYSLLMTFTATRKENKGDPLQLQIGCGKMRLREELMETRQGLLEPMNISEEWWKRVQMGWLAASEHQYFCPKANASLHNLSSTSQFPSTTLFSLLFWIAILPSLLCRSGYYNFLIVF